MYEYFLFKKNYNFIYKIMFRLYLIITQNIEKRLIKKIIIFIF